MRDRKRLLTQLETDIEGGGANLARQRELVADIAGRGQPSLFAAEMLLEFEAIYAKQLRLRDRLKSAVVARCRRGN